uniref:Glycerol kinase 5 n=1 Tax=Glenea cantor TaxID=983541 RepID=A0AAU8HQE8_9CUCU
MYKSGDTPDYVAALDIGTTTIRCQIINSRTETVGVAYSAVQLHYPKPGYVEIIPDKLLEEIIKVVKQAVEDAKISISEIKSVGISTQRATFITWKKDSGEYLHNLITWKDLRAVTLIKQVNSAWLTNVVRWAAYFLYLISRNKRYGVGSKLKFCSNHVSIRLLWVLQNIKEAKEAAEKNNLMFGTLETWLIYKLTGGETYVTDISNASATGLYDPFDLDWGIMTNILGIPRNIFPKIVNNDYEFGSIKTHYFGMPIKIGCVMADQSASMFGSCSFYNHDIKVTMGTGAFLDVNTSTNIHPSLNGMYPLIGWKLKDEIVYLTESSCLDAGSLIEWMLNTGFINEPTETADMALKINDTDGVFFIPAFSGLGPPINNEKAATGFIGIKPTTSREHLVRAVLESIVFRVALAYDLLKAERCENYKTIRIDGGVSRNNFICQMLADLTGLAVERQSSEMSVLGVAFLAGITCGIWSDKEQLKEFHETEKVFTPCTSEEYKNACRRNLSEWMVAAYRFKSWYKEN